MTMFFLGAMFGCFIGGVLIPLIVYAILINRVS